MPMEFEWDAKQDGKQSKKTWDSLPEEAVVLGLTILAPFPRNAMKW